MTTISIELWACDRAANRYRSWRFEAGQDLFGRWNARVTFGRIGCEGRTLRYDFRGRDEIEAFFLRCLRRRRTADKRIAVRYRLIDASPEGTRLLQRTGLTACVTQPRPDERSSEP